MKNFIFYSFLLFATIVYSQTEATTYTYSIKGLDTLRLDVYTPINMKKNDSVPVILWMHGGGFVGGNRNYPSEVKLAQMAAEKGYLGISISYRLTRKGQLSGFGCDAPKAEKLMTFKNAVIDYMDAAKFIYDNKALLGADVTKIIAGGSSAGAEGMLNAVYMREYFIDDLMPLFEKKHNYLLDYNLLILEILQECLGIKLKTEQTKEFVKETAEDLIDFRYLVNSKKVLHTFEPYTQVFDHKHGFMNDLSLLDLLFNEGRYAVDYLKRQNLTL